jgi:hypothetical protein
MIVEVVRYATRELANGIHLLEMPVLLFQLLARCDIPQSRVQDRAILPGQHCYCDFDREQGTIRSHMRPFETLVRFFLGPGQYRFGLVDRALSVRLKLRRYLRRMQIQQIGFVAKSKHIDCRLIAISKHLVLDNQYRIRQVLEEVSVFVRSADL